MVIAMRGMIVLKGILKVDVGILGWLWVFFLFSLITASEVGMY